MTNYSVTSFRMPEAMRNEIQRRVDTSELRSQTDLILRAVSEYFDRHPDTTATDLPYDHGDHGRYFVELNQLRAQAANDLEAAINLTAAAAEPRLGRDGRLRHAELARKFAVSAQAEYTLACWDRREEDRSDF